MKLPEYVGKFDISLLIVYGLISLGVSVIGYPSGGAGFAAGSIGSRAFDIYRRRRQYLKKQN